MLLALEIVVYVLWAVTLLFIEEKVKRNTQIGRRGRGNKGIAWYWMGEYFKGVGLIKKLIFLLL